VRFLQNALAQTPKQKQKSDHAKTWGSHRFRRNTERAYYELLYETGAAQTDAANLTVRH